MQKNSTWRRSKGEEQGEATSCADAAAAAAAAAAVDDDDDVMATRADAVGNKAALDGVLPVGIECLPDELLLAVFRFLDLPSLRRVTRVCRRWYAIANDGSLYRRLSFTSYEDQLCVNSQFLASAGRCLFTVHLRELSLVGVVVSLAAVARVASLSPLLHTLGKASLELEYVA